MKATYVKTNITSTVNVTGIVTVHYYEFDQNFVFEGETHDFWEMVYVDKGTIAVKSGEEELLLGRGDVVFHKPNEFHAVRAHGSCPDFFVISFTSKSPAMQHFEHYRAGLDKKFKPVIAAILREAESTYVIPKNDVHLTKLTLRSDAPIGGEQLVKTYLEQLLILLLREMVKSPDNTTFPTREQMEGHLVATVRAYIEDNVGKKITIAGVCDRVGYGKSYLCKTFRDHTGQSICAYANEKKVERARALIREGDMNFTEISDALAFDNPQYFSRVFKRITGKSPSEFKESLMV